MYIFTEMEMVEIPKGNIDEKVEEEKSEKEETTPLLEEEDTIATQATKYLIIDEQELPAFSTKGELCKSNL